MGPGTLRIAYLVTFSAWLIACGKDESGGSDDDDDATSVTTNTATTSPNTNSTSPNTATTSPNTNTSPNTSSGTGSGTTGTTAGTGGSGGSGGSGGGMNVGGSAGEQGNAGGSAGAPGGSGGSGGNVVIADDCGYEACGGELADTDWSYSRLCVERDALFASVESFCDSVEVISSNGEVTGSIGFTAATYDQDLSFSVTGEFQVPAECNLLGCGLVETLLTEAGGFSNASCTDSDGGCLCSATLEGQNTASASDYSAEGNELTLDDQTSTYCATDGSFKYTGVIQEVEFVYETIPQ